MKRILFLLLFILNSCIESSEQDKAPHEICDPCESPLEYSGYQLVFNDEFNLMDLGETWANELGDGCPWACGWGGGELQFYQKENVQVRNGKLVITAKKESVGNSAFTSGRVNTKGNFSLQFGRIDIRAKMPKTRGMWAAFWMLGDNIQEVGWPNAGHISITELVGGEEKGKDDTIIAKLLWDQNGSVGLGSDFLTLNDGKFNDKFNVFSLIWEPTKIKWLLNDFVYFEKELTGEMIDTFSKPFHLIMNLAVGGDFPGNPDETTIFPQELEIDYVRVFEKK